MRVGVAVAGVVVPAVCVAEADDVAPLDADAAGDALFGAGEVVRVAVAATVLGAAGAVTGEEVAATPLEAVCVQEVNKMSATIAAQPRATGEPLTTANP